MAGRRYGLETYTYSTQNDEMDYRIINYVVVFFKKIEQYDFESIFSTYIVFFKKTHRLTV